MAKPAVRWIDDDSETSTTPGDIVEEARPEWPLVSTLLNLVQAVQDQTSSDEEVVAVISHMLRTGRVRLCGIFAGKRVDKAA